MKTKTINLYEYEELSEGAKEHALSNFQEHNDMPFLSDDLTEYVKEQLKVKGYEVNDLKIYYSLGYCQGDGLMFEGTLKKDNIKVYIKHNNGYYCHSNTASFSFENFETGEELEDNEATEQLEEELKQVMKDAEKEGYSMIEYNDSEENFKEMCEANEWTFRSNGEMELL